MKIVQSPVQRWPGSVTLSQPLTLPQARLIEAALRPIQSDTADGERVWFSTLDAAQLPAIIACVEKWELSGFPETVTADNFPASPRGDSHKLIEWLYKEILAVYFGESEIPNE